jgi:hypothetical protein
MRITRLWPSTDWAIVWKNLTHSSSTRDNKSDMVPGPTWHTPTNERLHNVRLGMTDRCRRCDRKDNTTPPYRMWGWGNNVEWTLQKIATVLRMDPRYIPPEWILRLQFQLWPPQHHRAVLWVLARLVLYRAQQRRALTLHEYMDFLRRMKWKMYQRAWAIISAS